MFKKPFRALAVATLVAGIAGGVTNARAETDLTMLSSWDPTFNAVDVFAETFIEKVKKRSDGNFDIRLLGPETVPPFQQLQPVSTGIFDLLFTHGAYHLGETGMVFGMDTIVDDPQKRRASGIYKLIDQHYAKHNLKLIGVFSAASGYHFMLREPVGENGIEGRKIRASATYHNLVSKLGASSVTLPASGIYSALGRGVVDGAAWPVFGALNYKWYEVADYMTRPTFGITNYSLFMNRDAWEALEPAQQKLLVDVAKELEVSGRKHFADLWAETEAKLIELGMKPTRFTGEEAEMINTWFNQGVWQAVLENTGEDAEAFREMAREKGLINK